MPTQSDTTRPQGVDPRDIITPDSFSVAPELIGLPLARPMRRASAMLLDLLPLALLVNANAVFFAMAAAVLLWRASRGSGARPRGARKLLRVPAALLAFIVVLHVVDAVEERVSSPRIDIQSAAIADAPTDGDEPTSNATEDGGEEGRNNGERGALLGFLGGVADDLGIGFGWTALYFTAFLALSNGQTPGKRMVGIRVIRLDGRAISWWIAFERFGGYAASIWTGLLGFLQIFWDRNRQGIHDKIAETVVIRVRRPPPASHR